MESEHEYRTENSLDHIPSRGPRSDIPKAQEQPKEVKNKLQQMQDRILREGKDDFCNQVEEKEKAIENLMEDLKELGSDMKKAKTLHKNLKQSYKDLNKHKDSEKNNVIHCEKLKHLWNEMSQLKILLNELKSENRVLQNLRRTRGNQVSQLSNEQNKCNEEGSKRLIKRVMFLKDEILQEIELKERERGRINEKIMKLTNENKQYEEKIKETENFIKESETDEILATDRNKIKLIRNELIRTEADLDDIKYNVRDAEVIVNNMKQCLEDRQGLVNHYKLKCNHVKELLKNQDESISTMKIQFEQLIEKLNKEFDDMKKNISEELRQLIPVINELKLTQKRLDTSETLLCLGRSKYENMKKELSDLKSQIETLFEELNYAKKNELSEEHCANVNKQVALWENDTEVHINQRNDLKETIQKLKHDIKKANLNVKEKQKELCQLKMVEKDLRENLTEQFQQQATNLAKCRGIGSTEAYLMRQTQNLETERKSLNMKLACLPQRNPYCTHPCKTF
ncbi:hypothetical protein M8J76_015515 [Diaphorina citri]|nr:hypothetical protein M8J76_015515 [Diaphorina citri]KAI5751946.1 hypothetical protein M8J77_012377 [Diaphorina citri]